MHYSNIKRRNRQLWMKKTLPVLLHDTCTPNIGASERYNRLLAYALGILGTLGFKLPGGEREDSLMCFEWRCAVVKN